MNLPPPPPVCTILAACALQVKKAQIAAGLDIKIRDLFVTAGAALREGGLFLLAHEIRGDMEEVFTTMGRVSIQAAGRGTIGNFARV